MKANELMIGDWVMYRGEPIIIFEIDEYYERVNTEPDGYDSIRCIELSDLQPIPITAEILKKNFTYDSYGFFYFFGDNYLDIKEHTDGLWQVKVDEIMSSLPTWRMFVINVHELQHILRLAGINKEITI